VASAAQPVRRAIANGELPPDTDPVEVIRAFGAPFYYRMFITHEPLDHALAERTAAARSLRRVRACSPPHRSPREVHPYGSVVAGARHQRRQRAGVQSGVQIERNRDQLRATQVASER